jgi:two-component system chemotaxis response regulator CheY
MDIEDRPSLLLIDGDTEMLSAMKQSFQGEFDRVYATSNLEEAKSIFQANYIGLVIVEHNLPLIDGIALTEELKRIRSETSFILLSSQSDKEMVRRGFRMGIDDFFDKPCDLDHLKTRVMEIIGKLADGHLLFEM